MANVKLALVSKIMRREGCSDAAILRSLHRFGREQLEEMHEATQQRAAINRSLIVALFGPYRESVEEKLCDYNEDFKSGTWVCAGYQVGNCVISLVDIEWDCRPSLKTLKEIYSTIDKLQFIDPLIAKKVR